MDFLYFIMIAFAVGLAIAYVKSKSTKEEYYDYPIVENFMVDYTGGFSEASLIDIVPGMYGRKGYVLAPKDVSWLKRSRNKENLKIEPQIIFAYDYQVKSFSKTKFSYERDKIKIFPPRPELLPEGVKGTDYGIAIAGVISKGKTEKTIIDVVRSERDFEDKMLMDIKGKNLTEERIKEGDNLHGAIFKKFLFGDKKEKSYYDSFLSENKK